MKKYKVKLKPGDYIAKGSLNVDQYGEIGHRFIDDGCPKLEFPRINDFGGFNDQEYFGWAKAWGGFYHADCRAFDGSRLTTGTSAASFRLLELSAE
jgi:hypothetical protein